MALKSALEDLKQNTLTALSGLLARLVYLASLRGEGGHYEHWGMKSVYGEQPAERALRTAHGEIVTAILRTPLSALEEDLELSRESSETSATAYVKDMRNQFDNLLPPGHIDALRAAHLNSVLLALLSLKRHPVRATRSAS